MTKEEAREAVKELLEKNDPITVIRGFYGMYADDKITFEDFQFFVDECGYELSEDFINATDEERKTKFLEESEDGEENKDDEELELDEVLEKENEDEGGDEEKVEVEEEERASKGEDYQGEKVYDKEGNPTQVSDEGEKEQAEKLYNLKF